MPRALVTGCSTGIGRATATELTRRGYDVVATARRPETLDGLDVAARLALDVDRDDSVAAAVEAAGPVDVLVNNAGFGIVGAVERVPLADYRRVFETNVFGVLRMIQAVAPQMRERGSGAIVNVSSVAGRVVAPFGGPYSASKWAVEAISTALRLEIAHFGVRVIVIEPGVIATDFGVNEVFVGIDEPPYDELNRQWTAGRAALPGQGPDAEPPGPDLVARAIADALEADAPPLQWPVGADAEMIVAAREAMDYESFERTMRELLKVDW